MSKSQRTKGAAGEREWCETLAAHGFPKPKRNLGQARDSGSDVPCPPFLWEVKRHARFSIYEFIDQVVDAVGNQAECNLPAVALRGDNKEWLVVMRASDLLPLLRACSVDKTSTVCENENKGNE